MSELLDLVLSAHGCLERWREVQIIDLKLSTTGGLFRIKGFPEGLPNVSMHIQAQRPAVTITPYKTSDGRGYFTPKSVWIEDGEGSVIDERSDPRASFAGHVRATQWDQLQRHWYPGMEETCDAKAA